MKRLLLIFLLICAPVTAQHSTRPTGADKFRNKDRFTQTYDKFTDFSNVQVGPFGLSTFGTENIRLAAGFNFTGQELKDEPRFYLYAVSRSPDWRFLENREIILLVDGERINLGEAERKGTVNEPRSSVGRFGGGVSVTETLFVHITRAELEKISKAKLVEIKTGRFAFTLKDEHQEAFRDLLSLATIKATP